MARIGRLYPLRGKVETRGRIGRLYPARLHPWVVDVGGEGEAEVEGGRGRGPDLGAREQRV